MNAEKTEAREDRVNLAEVRSKTRKVSRDFSGQCDISKASEKDGATRVSFVER